MDSKENPQENTEEENQLPTYEEAGPGISSEDEESEESTSVYDDEGIEMTENTCDAGLEYNSPARKGTEGSFDAKRDWKWGDVDCSSYVFKTNWKEAGAKQYSEAISSIVWKYFSTVAAEVDAEEQGALEPKPSTSGTSQMTSQSQISQSSPTGASTPGDSELKPSTSSVSSTQSAKIGSETNPYAYLNRDEFTSERFKVELTNLPKFFGYGELKKLINKKLQLNSIKLKVMTSGLKRAFVNFQSQEERAKAVATLNGYSWKKATITASEAMAVQDPLVRKRAEATELSPSKKMKLETQARLSSKDLVRNATVPWAYMEYAQQVLKKIEAVNEYVAVLTQTLYDVNPGFLKKNPGEAICSVEEFKKSPVKKEYRNKCEFTVGIDPDTNEKTVGFRILSYREGSTAVGPIDDLPHLPSVMKKAAKEFQDYIRSSDIDAYDPETHTGVWKQLTVRTTGNNHLMMIVMIDKNELTNEESTDLIKKLILHFKAVTTIPITSFFLKEADKPGCPKANTPYLLFGLPRIVETLLSSKFYISPDSFFQVNTKAAECMYGAIAHLAGVDFNTTILDLCCGTGTIGIILASHAGQVVGVEMVEDAVRDALLNADMNKVSHVCSFISAKAEDAIDIAIARATRPKITAIVDPPRAGLPQRVLQCIRRCERITSLVYAACDVKAATKNFIDLCRPSSKAFKGVPFIPTKLIPVDMFPDTPHLEYVFLFERVDDYYRHLQHVECQCPKAKYSEEDYNRLTTGNHEYSGDKES